MIKAILFDADGVLIHTELATVELVRKHGIPQSVSQEFFSTEWGDILKGRADTREKMAPYLKEWGWEGSVEDYQKFWFEFEHKLDKDMIDNIQQLRKNNVKCYVATNQDKYRAEYMLKEMGFEHSFDGMFASAHLGEKKPDSLFFDKILLRLNLQPKEVLFWDDSEENVTAASKIGINSEIFKTMDSYKATMKDVYGL
ncbi:HAD family phosphatase [soil metagenome]